MKQTLGLIIGAGMGAIIAFYLCLWGYDVGAVIGVISHPGLYALIAGLVGAVVGLAVTVTFGHGVGRDQDRRTRMVVGGLGGAASGAMYGAAATVLALASTMFTLGFVLSDDRSSMFAGALGGMIIGTMMGLFIGVVFGGLIGSVVGAFVGAIPEAPPPPKPDFTFEDDEAEQQLSATQRARVAGTKPSASRETASLLRQLGKRKKS